MEVFQQLGISLLLGMLVGLQRERAESRIAGVRTFSLITVFGTLCALLDQQVGQYGVVVTVGFVAMVSLSAVTYYRRRRTKKGFGTTTEVAMLVMYGVGAYLVLGDLVAAIAIGAGTAVLLQFKPELHGIAQRLGDEDMRAIMQFALITCIVLPVLPDQTYGPFDVLNPFEIWLMVVLIVGIGLGGYISYKFLGERAGVLLGGVLGGAISSTATTASYARRSTKAPQRELLDALVIVIASCVTYARVLTEVAVVAPKFLPVAAGPLSVMLGVNLLVVLVLFLRTGQQEEKMPPQGNPSELRAAIVFGALYGLVLLGLAAAQRYFGSSGQYVVAVLSGLTDMDAITLSTARMVKAAPGTEPVLGTDIGWRLIVVAVMSNTVFKAGIVAVLGHRALFRRVAILFALPLATGGLLLALWPQL